MVACSLGRRALGVAFALGLVAGPAAADEPASAGPVDPTVALGSYEAAALRRALASRQLELELAPAGKVVGRIHVVNLDVFGPDEAWLTWVNVLHVTTKQAVVEREVLLRPGEPWDDEKIAETRRRISDPLFTTLTVVVPVKARAAGLVDILVVTRDIWSLRMNSKFEVQEGTLAELSLSLSENNLLGLRKQVAFVFDMDLGAFSLGPQYVDKSLGGSKLTLIGKWGAIFAREDGAFEGTRSYTVFSYPLWSLDRAWGASIVENHFDGVIRYFCGAAPFSWQNLDADRCDAPLPDGETPIPAAYGLRTFGLESSVVRQLGHAVKHRVSLGHELDVTRPRLLDDFAGDAATAAQFADDLFPRSERSSALFVRYAMFLPRYAVYRDLDSYDLAEDLRLGPEVDAEVASGRKELGSEVNFVSASLGAGWTVDLLGDGYARLSGGVSARRVAGATTDRVFSTTLAGASPSVLGARLVARLNLSGRVRDTNNAFFYVGGTSGLRGYPINFFRGDRQVNGNLELRTLPRRLLFSRVGAVAFWDVGHAAERWDAIALHQDVGVGFRGLVPQLQPFVFRLDWALPLTGPTAGFPGRFTAGVQQAF